MQKFHKHLLASLLILTGAFAAPAMAKGTPELSDRTFKTVNKVQELICHREVQSSYRQIGKRPRPYQVEKVRPRRVIAANGVLVFDAG